MSEPGFPRHSHSASVIPVEPSPTPTDQSIIEPFFRSPEAFGQFVQVYVVSVSVRGSSGVNVGLATRAPIDYEDLRTPQFLQEPGKSRFVSADQKMRYDVGLPLGTPREQGIRLTEAVVMIDEDVYRRRNRVILDDQIDEAAYARYMDEKRREGRDFYDANPDFVDKLLRDLLAKPH